MTIALPRPAPGTGVRAPRPHPPSGPLVAQLISFCGVGTAATALQAALYLPLRSALDPLSANLVAMVISTVVSIEGNRRLTFGRHAHRGLARQYAGSIAVFLLGLALGSLLLGLLGRCVPGAGTGVELAVLIGTDAVVGLVKFAALRAWVFPADRPARVATGAEH